MEDNEKKSKSVEENSHDTWRAHEYDQREVQFTMRSLQLLHGGGIVALLAFLGQIWNSLPSIRMAILTTMAIMVVGLACITLSSIIRLRAMHWMLHKKYPKDKFRRTLYNAQVYIWLRSISLVLFLVATGLLVLNLFNQLH